MPWNDIAQIEKRLSDALETFNWSEVEKICAALIDRINAEPDLLAEPTAKRLLQKLRRKRRFQLMTLLAEALMRAGQNAAQIQRQYAQALIDRGVLTASELVLQTIIQGAQTPGSEQREARGLIGRIYKQLYINAAGHGGRSQTYLQRAISEYLQVYSSAPEASLWHGINVVALLDRARRDGLSLQGMPDPCALAREVLEAIKTKENEVTELPAFDVATALEALIALRQCGEAGESCAEVEAKALEYDACKDADAFEVASTLRQFEEVWQLNDATAPCPQLLPILRAALLRREGGSLRLEPGKVETEILHTTTVLEKVFGADKTQTLWWYKTGLERCNSIARVERPDGKGHGTGWLVNAEDFFENQSGKLLLTNAHVISSNYDRALKPNQARANFQVLGQQFEVNEIVWSSPVSALDATFVSLKGDPPQTEPLPIDPNPMRMAEPPPRLYVIGHPGGRDLEFSLQDNLLLACSEKLIHYRTPTEGGSSGSPVFEPLGWNVVALHHAGRSGMQRLDGQPGTYDANEGISILALAQATRSA